MKYIKPLIDGNLEQFKQNIEASLYAKLSEKLDEVKTDVASDIYNEGRCVPCSQKINEGKKGDCRAKYEDCLQEVEERDGDRPTKQDCRSQYDRCRDEEQ